MRYFVCAILLGCGLIAKGESSIPQSSNTGNGSFYVNGIIYRYIEGTDYTVVVAAHSVINHKFVAVKVPVYNVGQQSVTVKPEEISVEDTVASQSLAMVSGAELTRRMRQPYNLARLAVNSAAGPPTDTPVSSDMMNPPVPRHDARDGREDEWTGSSSLAGKQEPPLHDYAGSSAVARSHPKHERLRYGMPTSQS